MSGLPTPVMNDQSSSDDEEDTHQCGRCKAVFNSLDVYLEHKKSQECKKRKFKHEQHTDVEVPLTNTDVEIVPNSCIGSTSCGLDKTDDVELPPERDCKEEGKGPSHTSETYPQATPPKKKWARVHSEEVLDDKILVIDHKPAKPKRRRSIRKGGGKSKMKSKASAIVKSYLCDVCNSVYSSEMELDRHLRSVHSQPRHVCIECGVPFSDQAKLKRHLASNSKRCRRKKFMKEEESLFGPSHEPKAASSESINVTDGQKTVDAIADADIQLQNGSVDKNRQDVSRKKPEFNCDECKESCETYKGILDHLEEQHPGMRPGICPFCGKWFDAKYRLLRHLSSIMHDDIPEVDITRAKAQIMIQKFKWARKVAPIHRPLHSKPSYPCSKCKEVFSTSSDLARHKASSHGKPLCPELTCDTCLEPFHKRVTYQLHLQEAHGIADPGPTKTCPVCLQTYRQRCHVYRHLDTLHTPKPNIPETVLQDLEGQEPDWTWLEHHRQGQLYICFICRKQIACEQKMRRHVQYHRMFAVKSEIGISVEQAHSLFAMLYLPNLEDHKPAQEHPDDTETIFLEIDDLSAFQTVPNDNVEEITISSPDDSGILREPLITVDTSTLGQMEQNQHTVLQIMEQMGNQIGKDHAIVDNKTLCGESTPGNADLSSIDTISKDGVSTSAEEIHRCCYCLSIFPDISTLYQHKLEIHKLVPVFRCVTAPCDMTFHSVQAYEEHQRKLQHPQVAFICSYCNGHFSSSNEVAKHKFDCHRPTSTYSRTTCIICHKDFANRKKLEDHMSSDHHDRTCSQCGVTLRTPALLTDHMLEHAGIASYLCATCGLSFGNRVALARHKLSHREEETCDCDQCGETFKTKMHLARHRISRHSDIKPFPCTVEGCESRFSRKDKLKDHMRMHRNEKPFRCEICNKAYRYREGLRYHLKTHSNDNKYFCQQCDKGFSKPSLLREHLLEVHETSTATNKAYPCTECKLCFSRPERLRRHQERDHGKSIKWKFTCDYCLKGFAGRRSYETHIKRTKHSEEGSKVKEVIPATKPAAVAGTEYSIVPVANTGCTVVDTLSNALGASLHDTTLVTVEATPGSIIQLPNQPNIQITSTSLPQITFSDPSQKQDVPQTVTVLQLTPAPSGGENKTISYVPSSVALSNQSSVTFFPGLQFTGTTETNT